MEHVRELFRKFRGSEGRVKAVTASGVLVLAAAVALAVGVLPALAASVPGVLVDWGGGPDACKSDLISLESFEDDGETLPVGTARGPSAADYELHIQNPKHGEKYYGSDGTEFLVEVFDDDTRVRLVITDPAVGGLVFYDGVINGGKKSMHYDFDLEGEFVSDYDGFTAPEKDNQEGVNHRVSHINLCYDLQPTEFACGVATDSIVLNEGSSGSSALFTEVRATTYANSQVTCATKFGFFFTDNNDTGGDEPDVLLDFGNDGGTVAGRMDITKEFPSLPFTDLRYLHDALNGVAVDVSYCGTRAIVGDPTDPADLGDYVDHDGNENTPGINPFGDVLPPDRYPKLTGVFDDPDPDATGDEVQALACKVFEGENAAKFQHNVIYFEFIDPAFF